MSITIHSISKINVSRRISLSHEITNILEIGRGDTLLFISDKKGNINVRKYKGEIILGEGEKYISSSNVGSYR